MKISVIGGGPGGLYFSILTKKAIPHANITVYERNKADDAFGFGVVFSDETLSEFLTRDPESYDLIRSNFAYWDDLDIVRNGETVRISGNGFCGCSRKKLLQLLQQRCKDVGVMLHFEYPVDQISQLPQSDIIVACDGINSAIRTQYAAHFDTQVTLMRNKFVWLGSTKPLDAFAYFFRETPHGTIVAHTYQYEEGRSTWIFECTPETWEKHQFETENENQTIAKLSAIFKEELDGHPLISNKSHWRQFPSVVTQKWHYQNIVLLGDAKATAHYSIGSGTKLAMECAIALSDAIVAHPENSEDAFKRYEQLRRTRVEMIQHAAQVSLDWFENVDRHMQHPFLQFAFGVMTRSKKVTFENLQLRDSNFTQKVLQEFNGNDSKTPAAFSKITIGNLVLHNRIVMVGTPQQKAEAGCAADWHLMHYGSRAVSGIGLLITEPIFVSATGKGNLHLIDANQQLSWKKINNFIHGNSSAKMAARLAFDGDPFTVNQDELISCFAASAKHAQDAEFDSIVIDFGSGSALARLLSPLTAKGTTPERLALPLKIFKAVTNAFSRAVGVSITACDWAEGGISETEVLEISHAFKKSGVDFINVTTGGTVQNEKPEIGRMYQTPFADMVRNEVHLPVITSGSITSIDQINTIILNKRADLVALGTPLLLDSGFVRNAQAHEGYMPTDIPDSYKPGAHALFKLRQTERKEKESMKKALKPDSHKK